MSAPKLLHALGKTSGLVERIFKKIYNGCDHNSSQRNVKELYDVIIYCKEIKVFFANQDKLNLNLVRRGPNKFVQIGDNWEFDNHKCSRYKNGFVEEFGDGRYLGSLSLSLLNGAILYARGIDWQTLHGYRPGKDWMSSKVNNKTFLSYCIQNVLHKHSKFLVHKQEIHECNFVYQRLREIHNVTTEPDSSERSCAYSYNSLQDNTDPLTIVPDYEYTFNGPVI